MKPTNTPPTTKSNVWKRSADSNPAATLHINEQVYNVTAWTFCCARLSETGRQIELLDTAEGKTFKFVEANWKWHDYWNAELIGGELWDGDERLF